MNKDNLLKLATYLLSDERKAYFDMRLYSNSIDPTDQQTNCGTVGCAIGHGPHAGIEKYNGETWTYYSFRVFEIKKGYREWTWCFSDAWYLVDNTPEGAAKRILYMIRHGIPVDWHMQLAGHANLTYLNETL